MKVRVYHAYYGCDTGCCGHIVELEDGRESFDFTHPYDADRLAWAREHAERVIRERWPECLGSIDWNSLDIEDVSDD